MEQRKKKNLIGKIIVVVCILAAVAAYFFIPSVNSLMKGITKMFASGDFTVVKVQPLAVMQRQYPLH